MAKIKGPLFSHGARGSIGKALTFRNSKGGVVAHSFGAPYSRSRQGPSQAQLDQRSIYAALAQQWRAMSAVDRAQYIAGGEPLGLTGWQFYVRTFGSAGAPTGIQLCAPVAYQRLDLPSQCNVFSIQATDFSVPDDCDFMLLLMSGWLYQIGSATWTVGSQVDSFQLGSEYTGKYTVRSSIWWLASPATGNGVLDIQLSDDFENAGHLAVVYLRGVDQVNPVAGSAGFEDSAYAPFSSELSYPGSADGMINISSIYEYRSVAADSQIVSSGEFDRAYIAHQSPCTAAMTFYDCWSNEGPDYRVIFDDVVGYELQIATSVLLRPA